KTEGSFRKIEGNGPCRSACIVDKFIQNNPRLWPDGEFCLVEEFDFRAGFGAGDDNFILMKDQAFDEGLLARAAFQAGHILDSDGFPDIRGRREDGAGYDKEQRYRE